MARWFHHPRSTGALRTSLSFAAFLVLLIVAELAQPSTAAAHARLVSATPISGSALGAAPAQFSLTFSEEIDLAFSSASLLAVDGSSIPLGQASVSADGSVLTYAVSDPSVIASGTFTLVWRAFSAVDAHVTSGVIAFSVGTGAAPTITGTAEPRPPWWRIVMHWLELVALTLLVGGAAFALFVARRDIAHLDPRLTVVARLSAVAALIAVLMTGYDLGLSATAAGFLDPPGLRVYRDLIADSRAGQACLVRLGCVLLIVLPILGARRRPPSALIIFPAGVVALGTLAVSGHAAAATPALPAIFAHWLHVAAVAVWLGTLAFLWLSLRLVEPHDQSGTDPASLVARFSRLGLVAIAIIVASGLIRFAAEVSGPRSLVDTDYGRVLIGKHLLVVVLLIAAGANQLVLVPRLRDRNEPTGKLIKSVRAYAGAEVAVAAIVLIASAALTELAPATAPLPVSVASRPITIDRQAPAGDLSVWLLARLAGDPGDRYTITLTDSEGRAPADLQRVIVQTRTTTSGAEAGDRFDAEQLSGSTGTYVFPALRLGLPGVWFIDVVVRRAGVEDVAALFEVDTTAAAPPPPRLVADDWRLPRLTLPASLLGFVAFAALIGGVALVRILRGLDPLAAGIILTMTALIAGGFTIQAYRQAVPVSAGTDLANPIAADDASIQRGGSTYRAFCLQCHGENAAGIERDDPLHGHSGSNLLDGPTQRLRDGDLYWAITHGVGGTEMPAYDVALTEAERWDLVNYLRSLELPPEPET